MTFHVKSGKRLVSGAVLGSSFRGLPTTPVSTQGSIMPRGGSKPGERRGGRKKGTPNKRTAERQAAIAAITASGKDPISFFADLLRNEQAPLDLRFQAAKELAPYAHPKLASVESRTGGQTHEDRLEEYRRLLSDD
jgi:hypothetical protein